MTQRANGVLLLVGEIGGRGDRESLGETRKDELR